MWNEIKTQGKKVFIGNIYIPPYNEEQLHTLDKVLESLNNDTITLLGDFIARSTVWDKHTKQKTKLEAILEDNFNIVFILQLTLIIHITQQAVKNLTKS